MKDQEQSQVLSETEIAELDDLKRRNSLLNKLDSESKPLTDAEKQRLEELKGRDTRKTIIGRMAETEEK